MCGPPGDLIFNRQDRRRGEQLRALGGVDAGPRRGSSGSLGQLVVGDVGDVAAARSTGLDQRCGKGVFAAEHSTAWVSHCWHCSTRERGSCLATQVSRLARSCSAITSTAAVCAPIRVNTVVFSMSSMVSATPLIVNLFKDFRDPSGAYRPQHQAAFYRA